MKATASPATNAASHPPAVGVVLLAAGASSRMGRPKLLLPWSDTTVLGHLLVQLRRIAPLQFAIVVAQDDSGIRGELLRLNASEVVPLANPQPEKGMFSSIRIAANWSGWDRRITHWLISLGDQPNVRGETFAELLAASQRHPDRICQPSRNGRPRHPVLLPAAAFRELAASRAIDLKGFLSEHAAARHLVEIDDPGLDLDLDYPADYERARELACAQNPS